MYKSVPNNFVIETSYFALLKKLDGLPVSISRFSPKWCADIKSYPILAPPEHLIYDYKKGKVSDSKYIEIYKNEVLAHLNPFEIVWDLYNKYAYLNNKIHLCCYEINRPDILCHRHIVANWLNTNLVNNNYFVIETQHN